MEKAKRGKYQEAIGDFSYEILISPNFAEAYKYRGIAYSKLEAKYSAIDDFRKAADLYLKQGKTDDYQDVLERIKKLQTTKPVTTVEIDYHILQKLLSEGQWKKADRETLTVMLKVAGREKEGCLSIEDIKNFPHNDLHTINQLWIKSSKGHFGFSAQKRIWQINSKTCYKYNYFIKKYDANILVYTTFSKSVGWRLKQSETGFCLLQEYLTFSLNAQVGHLPVSWSIGKQGNVYFHLWSSMFSRSDL